MWVFLQIVKKRVLHKHIIVVCVSCFDAVMEHSRLSLQTCWYLAISVVPEVMHMATLRAVLAQIALQGSETNTMELLGGTTDHKFLPKEGVI